MQKNKEFNFWRNAVVLLAIGISAAVLSYNSVGVMTITKNMRLSLNLTFVTGHWVINGYFIAVACFTLFGLSLGKIYGSRRIFIWGLIILLIASCALPFSPNAAVLISLRVVQGFAGALILPNSLSLIKKYYPRRLHHACIVIWCAFLTLGWAIGPIIGGYFAQQFNWGSFFWTNVPLIFFSLIVVLLFTSEIKRVRKRPIDFGGEILLTISMITFILFFMLNTTGEWTSTFGFVLITVSIVSFFGFFAIEKKARNPVFDIDLLRKPVFLYSNLMLLCVSTVTVIMFIYMVEYLRSPVFLAYNTLDAGLALVPFGLGIFVCSLIVPFIGKRKKLILFIAEILMVFAFLMLAFVDANTRYSYLIWPFIICGIGIGLSFALLPEMALSALSAKEEERGYGIITVVICFAAALGVAIGSFIFINIGHKVLQIIIAHAHPAAIEKQQLTNMLLGHYSDIMHKLKTLSPAVQALIIKGVRKSVIVSMTHLMSFSCLVSFIAACLCMLLQEEHTKDIPKRNKSLEDQIGDFKKTPFDE
jgi:MFS family permease